jgi:hypothetical protein
VTAAADTSASPPPPVLHGPGRRFRASWRLFLLPIAWAAPTVGAVAGTGLVWLTTLWSGYFAPWRALAFAFGSIFALSALWTVLVLVFYVSLCPLVVSVDGLKGFTFWGIPILLRWDEVDRAERKVVLGCPFLRVTSDRGRQPLWMALPLADPRGFAEAVRGYDGPDSPLLGVSAA